MYIHSAKYFSFLYNNKTEVCEQVKCITNLLSKKAGRILEVGGGTGALSIELAKMGHEVTTLEESPVFFGILLDKFKSEQFLNPFLTPLPLKLQDLSTEESYDVIVASRVVSSMPKTEWKVFFACAYKALKTSGFFVFDCSLVNKTRPQQSLQEIQKKIYGHNSLHHLASSSLLESGDCQEVYFKFVIKRKNMTLVEEEESHFVHLGTLDELRNSLRDTGFSNVCMYANWDLAALPEVPSSTLIVAYV